VSGSGSFDSQTSTYKVSTASETFELQACFSGLVCESNSYLLNCCESLSVNLEDLELYYGELFTFSLEVSPGPSELSELWLEDAPSGMVIKNNQLIWRPLEAFDSTVTLHFARKDCVWKKQSKSFRVSVVSDFVPQLNNTLVSSPYTQCLLTQANATNHCELSNFTEILGVPENLNFSLLTQDSNVQIKNSSIVWNRDSQEVSSEIVVVVSSGQGANFSEPFFFYVNFIPEVQELSPANYTAYVGGYWCRHLKINDGNLSYPESLPEENIQLSNNNSESISLHKGVLEMVPQSEGTLELQVCYTDQAKVPFKVCTDFSIAVQKTDPPSCDFSEVLSQVRYVNTSYYIDLKSYCSPDLVVEPPSLSIEVPSNSRELNQYLVTLRDTSTLINTTQTLTLVAQPELCIDLSNSDLKFGVAFRTRLVVCEDFYIEELNFEIASTKNLSIETGFGIIDWEYPDDNLDLSITVSVSSSVYKPDSKSFNFSIEVDKSTGRPEFTEVPITTRSGTVGETWAQNFSCNSEFGSTTLSVDNREMDWDGQLLSWTPTEENKSSSIITVKCEFGLNNLTFEYQFILADPDSINDSPLCVNQTIDINSEYFRRYQVEFEDIDSDLATLNLEFQNLEEFPGLITYNWGYIEWDPALEPLSDFLKVNIDDGNTQVNCSIKVNYNKVCRPEIGHFTGQFCDNNCTYEVPMKNRCPGESAYSENSTYGNFLGENLFEWNPVPELPFEYVEFNVSQLNLELQNTVFFCHGVDCRLWPYIRTVKYLYNECTHPDCSIQTPEDKAFVEIEGFNFREDNLKVWVANKECKEVSPVNLTYLTCQLSIPDPQDTSETFAYLRVDNNFTKPVVFKADFNELTPIQVEAPAYCPVLSNGVAQVPLYSERFFETCTCSCYPSCSCEFDYKSQNYSESHITLSSSKQVSIELDCLGHKSNTFSVFVSKELRVTDLSPSSGHNHGMYSVTASINFPANYEPENVLLKLNQLVLKPRLQGTEAFFVMPPFEESLSTLIVRVSINKGLSFTEDQNSQNFTLQGLCSDGEYIQQEKCELCPEGYKCEPNKFNSEMNYYTAKKPCDLGEHQPQEGQTECILCSVGFQCFCRGMAEQVVCDSGFVCDEEGLVKRWKPCPKGYYCGKGTYKENYTGKSEFPKRCLEDVYCLYGIYQSQIVTNDIYTPQSCYEEYMDNCDNTETNPKGINECSKGYYCPEEDKCLDGKPKDTETARCICPKGHMCPSNFGTEPILCPAGTFSDRVNQEKCKTCSFGYYCPYDTPPDQELPCEPGNYCGSGVSTQSPCFPGTYQNETGATDCKICTPGHYCPDGQLASQKVCEPGKMCPDHKMTQPQNCPEGYYCPEGTSNTPIPCPLGSKCPVSSKEPTPCPINYYTPQKASTDCELCPYGTLCTALGTSLPKACEAGSVCQDSIQGDCPPGFYCETGTGWYCNQTIELLKPDPSNSTELHECAQIVLRIKAGDSSECAVASSQLPQNVCGKEAQKCKQGTFCTGKNTQGEPDPSAEGAARKCEIGTYNNLTAQMKCFVCPRGHECPYEGMAEPLPCAPGTYRPPGISPIHCIPCPEGTFSSNYTADSVDYCLPCPSGVFCKASGVSQVNQTTSEPCPKGHYCPQGTKRATRTQHSCPKGYFCYQGTKSLEEALLCPAGRFCSNATGAEPFQYENCLRTNNCTIGMTCSRNHYCPKGTESQLKCPGGTVSFTGSQSLRDCKRSPDVFYETSIVAKATALNQLSMEALTYKEFQLDFLSHYALAKMPEDYQLTLLITFPNNSGRRLSSEPVRVMVASHKNYGTKLGVPLKYSDYGFLSTERNSKIGVYANVNLDLEFELEFLEGQYHYLLDWNKQLTPNQTMHSTQTLQNAFSYNCLLKQEASEIFEAPTNLYRPFLLDSNYKLQSENPKPENRFSVSFVKEEPLNQTSKYESLPKSLWSTLGSQEYSVGYLPYISDCSRYGSFISIQQLTADKRCQQTNSQKLGVFDVGVQPKGLFCNFKLTCDYNLDLRNLNRKKHWFEAYTRTYKLDLVTKDKFPPFYILSQNSQSSVPVVAYRSPSENFSKGKVPQKVKLDLGYFQRDSPQVLKASLEFSEFLETPQTTFYQLEFTYQALSWSESFNNNAFSTSEYSAFIFMTLFTEVMALFLGSVVVFLVRSGNFWDKKYLLRQLWNSSVSCLAVMLLLAGAVSVFWTIVFQAGVLDYQSGNFTNKVPVSDSERIQSYRGGRLGCCLFGLGVMLLKVAADCAVPPLVSSGFSYQDRLKEQRSLTELCRRQGLFYGCLFFGVFSGVLAQAVGSFPLLEDHLYLVVVVYFALTQFASVFVQAKVQDSLIAGLMDLMLQVCGVVMILNCRKFTTLVFSLVVWQLLFNLKHSLFQSFYQKLLSKVTSATQETLSTNELLEHSIRLCVSWILPGLSLLVYLFHNYLNFFLNSQFYLYLLVFFAVSLCFESAMQLVISVYRSSKEKHSLYQVYNLSAENYQYRSANWALSIAHEMEETPEPIRGLAVVGWSSQFYITYAVCVVGYCCVIISVQLWVSSSYLPFLDYWFLPILVFTLLIFYSFKVASFKLAFRFFWKPDENKRLFKRGMDGEFIYDVNDHIRNVNMKRAIEKLREDEVEDYYVSELAEKVIDTIKNNSESRIEALVELLRPYRFNDQLNTEPIFENYTQDKEDQLYSETEEEDFPEELKYLWPT